MAYPYRYITRKHNVWARELDIYGRTCSEVGEVGFIPFLYQGQYLDGETGLAYNHFRYYSPETGAYISQDSIRLEAGLSNLYAYVHDVNAWVDPLGLECIELTTPNNQDPYKGVREASEYLKNMGVTREKRKEIIESFDKVSIRVKWAVANEYGIRFFWGGGEAKPMGQYLTDTFGPMTNRANLALPPQWNAMTGIKQWKIKEGTTIIRGIVAPQQHLGRQYIGGANQIFMLEPWKYGTLL